MKRLSKEQTESRIRDLEHQNTIHMLAMNDACSNQVNWFARFSGENGSHYRMGVSRLSSANGGILFTTYSIKGQGPYTTVQYLDDALVYWRQFGHSETEENDRIRRAVYEAMRLRNAALEVSHVA